MGRLQELRKKFNVPEPKQPTAEQIARLRKTEDVKSDFSTPGQAGGISEPSPLKITPGNQEHARRRVTDPYNIPKPVEPKPFDFGLTEERINELKRGKSFGVITALALFAVAAVYVLSQDTHELLNWPVIFLFTFLLPLTLSNAIGNAIWRRRQPDYNRFQSFEVALESYEKDLQQWLREQTAWWRSLSGWRFEAELARLFERQGYESRKMGGIGDGGVDLILRKDGKEIIVQCKAHARPVGPGAVRDLYGAMMHKHAMEAWLVSTMGFSRGAKSFSVGKPLKLIQIDEILRGTF